MIRLKDDTVVLTGLRPEMLFAIRVAEAVYDPVDLVITSVNDGRHSATSLHYAGCAVDIRTRNLPSEIAAVDVAAQIKDALNIDFDVLFEGDHIHIEWQPRRPHDKTLRGP